MKHSAKPASATALNAQETKTYSNAAKSFASQPIVTQAAIHPAVIHPTTIHPTAIIDPRARVPASCSVGPYCVIGPDVELGERCKLVSHVVIEGPTQIGNDNAFFPFCAIGMAPQDTSYRGEPTRLEIGDNNEIREYVTISRGTVKGGGLTRVGDHTLIMAYAHIGHDSVIGDHCMLVNGATLGGHVTVEEWAVVGALCPVHQYVRVGAHSYVGGGTTITQDVLPFSMTSAARNTNAYGMNKVGLERRGFSADRIRKIHHAYKTLLASKLNTSQALEKLKAETDGGEDVELLIRFIESSERGVIK
jgi:UDP-N-acetylglucosamine acyltransferase